MKYYASGLSTAILWLPEAYDVTIDTGEIVELDRIGTGAVIHTVNLRVSACLGVARGPACILESADEIVRYKQGYPCCCYDSPRYLPAMKRAAAFVTDEEWYHLPCSNHRS